MHAEPKVTIDLSEYNELLALKTNNSEIDHEKWCYMEFNPRDLHNYTSNIDRNRSLSVDTIFRLAEEFLRRKKPNARISNLSFEIGRLDNNSEIHFFKAPLY